MPSGLILDLDSEARIGTLPAYLVGVESNEINLKLHKPLLTKWWHVNVCDIQVITSYKVLFKFFEHLHEIWKGDRLSLIDSNGIAIGKIKKRKSDRKLFCTFSVPTGHTT